MPIVTVSNVHLAYGSNVILDGATVAIEPGEKVGLVGRNGSGKTSLMKIMLGRLQPDRGQVQVQRGMRVGYLSQDPDLDPEESLRGAAEGAFKELHELHLKLNDVFDRMATADEGELDRLLKQQGVLEGQIEAAGGYAIDHKVDATLHGLGFTDDQFDLKVKSLSGGQKGRLGLARLLLETPDVLLLDEPTNHLDIAGREWLEEFLAEEYPGAVILVSHDRWLLDRVVDRIIEVERGMIREYPGNYEKYLALRSERQLTEQRVYDKQLDRVRQEEQFIRRYKAGQRAKQARGRESRLERFKRDEMVERPMEVDVMNLKLPKPPRSGDQIIIAEHISKRYGDLVLFDNLDITITRGERIGIIGPNGIGKTTLVKCLLGEMPPDSGRVRLGSRLNIGYYQQTHEHLDLSLTVWQYLQSVIVSLDGSAKASEQQARNLAGSFLFSGNEQDKALGDLSGGERSRAVIAGLVSSARNVLVLDEPTNHLDIPSAERLEYALSPATGFDGTILLITHDRALLQATCDRLIVFDGGGKVSQFYGTYRDWHDRHASRQRASNAPAGNGGASGGLAPDRRTSSELPRENSSPRKNNDASRKREKHSNPMKVKAMIRELEELIEQCESRIAEIDQQMTDPHVYTDGERCRALAQERAELEAKKKPAETEWSRLVEEAGEVL
jgi:ATP-binding cassette, subfamily F, member 3